MSLVNRDSDVHNKTLANRIQTHIKKIIYHDYIDFIPEIQEGFDMNNSTNVINYINGLKDKNYTFISTNAEKVFDKNLTCLHNKSARECMAIENKIKAIYEKETNSQHHSNGEKPRSKLTEVSNKTEISIIPVLFQYSAQHTNWSNRAKERN